ncbi:hypothetical protein P7K49_015051 [Saguinus oedipus]|uniref:Uncharacterized protein n=1 Tax=Saguinus oedipus TaxID=9490 RepID=A0ABQ9V8H5_SAGOE|nr:hypothetical protein P7K49_015051 [Saguinus oedipus]
MRDEDSSSRIEHQQDVLPQNNRCCTRLPIGKLSTDKLTLINKRNGNRNQVNSGVRSVNAAVVIYDVKLV